MEYKYGLIHKSAKTKKLAEADYDRNGEGSYILEVFMEGERWYLDATSTPYHGLCP